MAAVSTGIDLVEVERLVELRDTIRQKFIERVYTPLEISWAQDNSWRLAELFAAKEAVAKALGSGIGEISWQEIEISISEGEYKLQLSARALRLAQQQDLRHWQLSLSHTDMYAVALVVAWPEP